VGDGRKAGLIVQPITEEYYVRTVKIEANACYITSGLGSEFHISASVEKKTASLRRDLHTHIWTISLDTQFEH